MLLRFDHVSRSFGVQTLFHDVCLDVHRGDRIGLVGPNGAGKTTLLRIAAGDDPPDTGQVIVPRDVRVGMLRQEIDPSRSLTVKEEASTALTRLDELERTIQRLEHEMAEHGAMGRDIPPGLAQRYEESRTSFEHAGGYGRVARVEKVLAGLGFSREDYDRPLNTFSGGWLMRVELAKLFLASPDVLLLDEPTNHLDLPSIEWFEETIRDFKGGVIIISHDRMFLRKHATRIAELELGRFYLYEFGFDAYLREKAERRARLVQQKKTQDRQIAQTKRFIERFRYKNTKAKQVQSRIKELERRERVVIPGEDRRRLRLRIPPVERSGDQVLRLERVYKTYTDTVVYRGMNFQLRRGDRLALVGPNGAGKSTLLRIAAGVLDFERGERKIGHKVTLQYYAQHQLEALDPSRTVLEELESTARGPEDRQRCRSHLGALLFSGDDVEKRVSILSGGEKARLALAKILLRPANFLVLDEPTNHLDLRAREVLEEALTGYTGTMLFISHDRTLINALASRVVEVREGRLREFTGTYDDYMKEVARAETGASGSTAAVHQIHSVRDTSKDSGSVSAVQLKNVKEDISSRASDRAPPDQVRPRMTKAERVRAREMKKERLRRLSRARRRQAEIERAIEVFENRVEDANVRLAEPDVYMNGGMVREIRAEQNEAQAEIARLEAEWEILEAEIAGLEGVDSPKES
jgi:ATP-binding cassette subfamily F protein 3